MTQYQVTNDGKVRAEGTFGYGKAPAYDEPQFVHANSEIEAARQVLAPKGGRYAAVSDSYSGHCCFGASILDLGGTEVTPICEVFDMPDAIIIAAALNLSCKS